MYGVLPSLKLIKMEEIINKIFKEKYPKGLSAEYTKEEMVGYMMAINDIKEQLSIHVVSNSLDLVELERKIDEALDNETSESLKEWLHSKRL